jgi:hypothetical protein
MRVIGLDASYGEGGWVERLSRRLKLDLTIRRDKVQKDRRGTSMTLSRWWVVVLAPLAGSLITMPQGYCDQQRSTEEATAAEKKEFLELLPRLPVHGKFYTEDAVRKAAPYVRVMLALTPSDVGKRDVDALAVLSHDLCDLDAPRNYAVRHFGKIAHPTLQLGWAVMLFDKKVATPEIVAYLKAALKSKEQAKTLAEMTGPDFTDFKKRVEEANIEQRNKR